MLHMVNSACFMVPRANIEEMNGGGGAELFRPEFKHFNQRFFLPFDHIIVG